MKRQRSFSDRKVFVFDLESRRRGRFCYFTKYKTSHLRDTEVTYLSIAWNRYCSKTLKENFFSHGSVKLPEGKECETKILY